MKLFDEMEKCFPEMEKQWDDMIKALDDLYLTPELLESANTLLGEWVKMEYLQPEGELHALFVQAGVRSETRMASIMVEWMHRARRFEGRPYVLSRTNISLALQLDGQYLLP